MTDWAINVHDDDSLWSVLICSIPLVMLLQHCSPEHRWTTGEHKKRTFKSWTHHDLMRLSALWKTKLPHELMLRSPSHPKSAKKKKKDCVPTPYCVLVLWAAAFSAFKKRTALLDCCAKLASCWLFKIRGVHNWWGKAFGEIFLWEVDWALPPIPIRNDTPALKSKTPIDFCWKGNSFYSVIKSFLLYCRARLSQPHFGCAES